MKYAILKISFFTLPVLMTLFSCHAGSKIKTLSDDILGEFVLVKGGSYIAGNTHEQEQPCKKNNILGVNCDSAQAEVERFFIGKTEITQAQWQKVMGSNPSFHSCPNCPVENITRSDINAFLTKINKSAKSKYRLPSLSEWEYAARGGIMNIASKYPGSNDLNAVAWHNRNSNNSTHEVAQKQPNELGLYDMAGNVAEFCNKDRNFDTDLTLDKEQEKGGAFLSDSSSCKTGYLKQKFYHDLPPDENNNFTGFRLLMEVK